MTGLEKAVRGMTSGEIEALTASPGKFAVANGFEVSEVLAVIAREQKLRKSHKIWRK